MEDMVSAVGVNEEQEEEEGEEDEIEDKANVVNGV